MLPADSPGLSLHLPFAQHVEDDGALELKWSDDYKLRKQAVKEALKATTSANASSTSPSLTPGGVGASLINKSSLHHGSTSEFLPQIICHPSPDSPVSIQGVLKSVSVAYGLNLEQNHAFHLVTDHAILLHSERGLLYMYMGGAGGTGKSQVIKALSAFFMKMNESRRFRICAFTGAAAKNINGSTLHSPLNLSQ
ncbi:uncharacterized protein EI90DRAFT_2939372, partial [Cantharellus anzutake]|uniref:uncharacterized protein n=1 Tax=Cantharellus anzutake TaxID=1750568 RepID=UPI0019065B55